VLCNQKNLVRCASRSETGTACVDDTSLPWWPLLLRRVGGGGVSLVSLRNRKALCWRSYHHVAFGDPPTVAAAEFCLRHLCFSPLLASVREARSLLQVYDYAFASLRQWNFDRIWCELGQKAHWPCKWSRLFFFSGLIFYKICLYTSLPSLSGRARHHDSAARTVRTIADTFFERLVILCLECTH
jgi:hypothetical protein